MRDNLILIRNILYRWFLIGFVFLGLTSIIYIFGKDFSAEIAQTLFRIEPEEYYRIMIYFISTMKLILFMFILFPALAIHSMTRKEK